MKSRKLLLFRNISILIFSLLFVGCGVGCVYTDHLLSRINYVSPNEESQTESLFQNTNASSGGANAKAGLVGCLYHDDAVNNILLLGTDDYQINDPGRSDSMMLISVDNQHKKLKVTSFMRDMYVSIPGLDSNRLNAAYSLSGGKVDGARKIVSTIEANFGVDIDRFVTVDFKAFPEIIDRLGGVEIELSNETNSEGQTEAGLINAYSCDPHLVHVGRNKLSGLQARYYSRIRDIGDDYERTLRQRKVFAGIVNQLKTSSLSTIYNILADTLNLVTTNMQKNEILSLASNSLTYLNYPISQDRIPGDNEYHDDDIRLNGNTKTSKVLVPDLEKCRRSLMTFIYENNLPKDK